VQVSKEGRRATGWPISLVWDEEEKAKENHFPVCLSANGFLWNPRKSTNGH